MALPNAELTTSQQRRLHNQVPHGKLGYDEEFFAKHTAVSTFSATRLNCSG